MKTTVMFEVFVDLVLEDVLNDGHLFEANPYHDASGKFTSKDAAKAYGSGAMAKGRAAGMKAKAQGMGKEQIRTAIKDAMQKHIEAGGNRAEAQGRLGLIRTKIAKGTLPGQVKGGAIAASKPAAAAPRFKDARLARLSKQLDQGPHEIANSERALVNAVMGAHVGRFKDAGYKRVEGANTFTLRHPETGDTVEFGDIKGDVGRDQYVARIQRVKAQAPKAAKNESENATTANDRQSHDRAYAFHVKAMKDSFFEGDHTRGMAHDAAAVAHKKALDAHLSGRAEAGMESEAAQRASKAALKGRVERDVEGMHVTVTLPPEERRPTHPTLVAARAAVDAVKKAGAEGGAEAGQKEFVNQVMGLLGAVPRRRR